ncbi:MAG: tol-pal system-associated acyl-CoA thioesterase [Lentilitoribacter sp.]
MSDHFTGELTENGHRLVQRVYYEDTDFSGAVYHARYLHFMERARTEFIRCKGLIQSESHATENPADAVAFMVGRIEIDYRRPARMDDVLTIATEPLRAKGARMVLSQKIHRGEELLIEAQVTVACVNGLGRPRRLPESLL